MPKVKITRPFAFEIGGEQYNVGTRIMSDAEMSHWAIPGLKKEGQKS